MNRKVYNKLVRDKIPEIIAADGQQAVTRMLSDAEYLPALIKKLGEEYEEFKSNQSIEELADLQEVILALADELASQKVLEEVRTEKAAKRGAFQQRIFLERTE